MLKRVFAYYLVCFLLPGFGKAQSNDSIPPGKDSLPVVIVKHDSLVKDSALKISAKIVSPPVVKSYDKKLKGLLSDNLFLNTVKPPVSFLQAPRNYMSKDPFFYVLACILLFLGILKVAFPRYFSNLIRVFFNTSLRQSQLTDQLLQARLPSMFFNIFFAVIGGWYLYLLLYHYDKMPSNNWKVLLVCISGLILIYSAKFCALKFAGWLTGYREEADTYIFIVFLINKILSFCLVPIVVIIPFSKPELVNVTIIISFAMIALMFLMRFFRSYGLLQSRLKVSSLHFLIYIIGIELLPLLLIYRSALVIMSKNL